MKKFTIIFSLLLLWGCNAVKKETQEVKVPAVALHDAMQAVTDVIVHDIFSPPVASRIYAYSSVGAYEVLASQDSAFIPLSGQLHGLAPIPQPENPVHAEVAAVDAFLRIGEALIFSEDRIISYRQQWYDSLKNQGMSEELLDNTLAYSQQVKDHIMEWASHDMYKQTRTYQKHHIGTKDGEWQPTPPAYMEAIEPHWNKIRTFVLDSASQFRPAPPTQFSIEEGSAFYKEVMQVYETGKGLTEEQKEIASFWDCNPYVMNVRGHVMFATKKITPGGHWMGITKIACMGKDASLIRSAEAYALTAVTLADAFISCWDEKYRSNLIRPETVINRHVDEEWMPLLQTPPFPEYPSGHSVISTAAAEMLTSLFGDAYEFADSTEASYGLPVREFDSFRHASQEAAMSRLYGGIHYMPAIENGVTEGRGVGRFMIENINTRKPVVASNQE
ncbi:vanadium-dependent haloperoxidase [Roseivirga sp. BDSF3-8]|uniref:vanadium-dependent haloperoxidase n=1 Tax=Roseivirga sp. BDSF3-8 TaxID=3241598 RepID=UPI0035326790